MSNEDSVGSFILVPQCGRDLRHFVCRHGNPQLANAWTPERPMAGERKSLRVRRPHETGVSQCNLYDAKLRGKVVPERPASDAKYRIWLDSICAGKKSERRAHGVPLGKLAASRASQPRSDACGRSRRKQKASLERREGEWCRVRLHPCGASVAGRFRFKIGNVLWGRARACILPIAFQTTGMAV